MIKTVGWVLLLIATPLIFILFLQLLATAKNASDVTIISLFSMALLSLHLQRKDVGFLRKLDTKMSFIFLTEYNLFILPLSLLFLILLNKPIAFALMHVSASIIAFIPFIQKSRKRNKSVALSFIPTEAFELKSGIRRYWLIMLLIYFPGIFLSQFVGAALISIVLFSLVAVSFYDELEDRSLLETFYFRPNWLVHKIWVQIKVYLFLHLPHIVLFLVFHYHLWYILLVALIVGIMQLLFGLFYKYASYVPKRKRAYNQTAFSFYIIGFIIPFFFPASLFYLLVYFRRAKKRIDYFFKPLT